MENVKRQILSQFKLLEFNEEQHVYHVRKKRIKLSVSGIIKKFVKPFDTQGISKKVAGYRNVPQAIVIKEWQDAGTKACALGTKVHLFGELYPFDRTLKPRNKFEEAVVKFWTDLPEHIIPVIMELQMYHKKFMFAGTADVLLYNTQTDEFIIGDYKTNKDLFKNYKGQKMLGIFSHLLDSPFNKYQLQLSFYQILFEQLGLKVSSRKIIWLKPTGDYQLYDTENLTGELNNYLENNPL